MPDEAKETYTDDEQLKVGTHSVKCSNCGSNMVFDPNTQKLYCPHCDSVKEFNTDTHTKELDLATAFSKGKKWESDKTVVFKCENCGAKVVLNAGETAKNCPFCGTAHVQKTDELAGLKPNGVLPFLFDAVKAAEYCKAWVKKRLFAPSKFKRTLVPENVHGVYLPVFTFDSYTTSTYVGRLGKTHTKTVGSGKNQRQVTYTEWFNVSGTYYEDFDDVLISAENRVGQKNLNKIAPFDTNNGKAYEERYLLGFMAYRYDRDLTDCWGDAKSVMDARIRSGILSQYSYDKVDYLNVSTSHERVTFKYVMTPVYVGNYSYKTKVYNFYVNGTSGKVTGKTPKSFWRIAFAVLCGLIVAAAIGALVYYLNLTE